jgi:methionine biosynthesis protein MetW
MTSILEKVPVLRTLVHFVDVLTRPAPLREFADYDEYWIERDRTGWVAPILHRYQVIADRIPDGSSVLDIGCGDGGFLRYLRSRRSNLYIVGMDLSGKAINLLRASDIDGHVIDTVKPLREQLDRDFDYVVLMEVIEHVPDAENLVRQALAFNPKCVYITIPNVGYFMHRLRLMFGRFPVASIIYHMKEHVRFWTVKDFFEWARVMNLEVSDYVGQLNTKYALLRTLIRCCPSLFAAQVVFECRPKHARLAEKSLQ